jgi:hypothetical protein
MPGGPGRLDHQPAMNRLRNVLKAPAKSARKRGSEVFELPRNVASGRGQAAMHGLAGSDKARIDESAGPSGQQSSRSKGRGLETELRSQNQIGLKSSGILRKPRSPPCLQAAMPHEGLAGLPPRRAVPFDTPTDTQPTDLALQPPGQQSLPTVKPGATRGRARQSHQACRTLDLPRNSQRYRSRRLGPESTGTA